MDYVIREMDIVSAREIILWKYEKPYSLYNLNGSDEDIKELLHGSYYSAYNKSKELAGYFCFGESAQVPIGKTLNSYDDKSFIDIGLGLQPELCGKGYGVDFTTCGLRCAKNMFSARKFRLTVAKFNQRAIKVYEKIGFRRSNISFSKDSETRKIEFIIMTLEDWADFG